MSFEKFECVFPSAEKMLFRMVQFYAMYIILGDEINGTFMNSA